MLLFALFMPKFLLLLHHCEPLRIPILKVHVLCKKSQLYKKKYKIENRNGGKPSKTYCSQLSILSTFLHAIGKILFFSKSWDFLTYRENFMALFTTLSVVIWFSTGTLGIFATLVYVFTMRVVIYDVLSMAIITTLSTSILFRNFCYILLWILPRSAVKIAIRI